MSNPADDLADAAAAVLAAPPESAHELAARLWLRAALRRYRPAPERKPKFAVSWLALTRKRYAQRRTEDTGISHKVEPW